MGPQGVVFHQSDGNLSGQQKVQSPLHVDPGQFLLFEFHFCFEFSSLARKIGLLGV
jgi:hypothetical protein